VPLKYATHKTESVSVILSTKQYTVVTEAALWTDSMLRPVVEVEKEV